MGARKPGPQGEHEISRKTIAWGMPDVIRCLRCEYSCAYLTTLARTRLRVHWAPGIPRALYLQGRTIYLQTSGATCRENASACLDVMSLPGARAPRGLRRMRSQRRWMNGLGCLTIASEICKPRPASLTLRRVTYAASPRELRGWPANRSCEAAKVGAPGR
jgi:hypothetical protein